MKINQIIKFILVSVFINFLFQTTAFAQDSDVEELNLIEMELDKSAKPAISDEDETAPTKTTLPETSRPEVKSDQEALEKLTEFRQVSVLQKRYLPRTGRFQLYAGPMMTLNDPWFNVLGGSFKFGYNLTESLGLEANYSFMSTDKTMALKELSQENNIQTQSFVSTKSYYSLGVNWTPIYGKMTWLNEKIVYYDTYFGVGFGGTEIQNGDVQDTLSLNLGQIFSISKAYAFRWDLTWNFFEARQIDATQGTYNNVILSAGFSFFFPEATYR